MSTQTAETTPLATRKPYHGSCHCGLTKYIVFLTLPTAPISDYTPSSSSTPSIRIYKCNCTACTKMSIFHLRVASSPDDFMLLSPLDFADGGLGDYQCDKKRIHFYFCKACGVRCFAFAGEGEFKEVEIEGAMRRVWSPRKEGWAEGGSNGYLSINAVTVDAGQKGFDLRDWHEKGWVKYVDRRSGVAQSGGEPFEGGMY